MSDANTRRVRYARSALRAASTLLRESRGLDSMSEATDERVRLTALEVDALAGACSAIEREMNFHTEAWNRRRRSLESRRVTR